MAYIGGDHRPFHLAPWHWTLACGAIKLLLAAAAIAWPLLVELPLPSTVGWMLVIGGLTELILAWRGRASWIGRLTFGSGAVTVLAGAMFIRLPWSGLFPLVNGITVWLLLRGLISLDVAIQSARTPLANWGWIMLRGGTDLALGLLLLLGVPLVMFTVAIFGETTDLMVSFLHLLAISFGVAGAGLMAIALAQRSRHLPDAFLTAEDESVGVLNN